MIENALKVENQISRVEIDIDIDIESVQTFAFRLRLVKSNVQTFAHSIKIELSQ